MKIIKQISTDAEELYKEYLNYQSGDNLALNRIFVETNDRFYELTDKYYSRFNGAEFMDNVLDAEFIKADISDEQKKHCEKVKFRFMCLNRILANAKREYSKKSVNTGYINGVYKGGGYKKFRGGEYDTSDIQDIMIEIIIMIFQGKKVSDIPITDAKTLLENIKFHLIKEIGQINDTIYKNVPEIRVDIDSNGEENCRSYLDKIDKENWLKSQGGISRLMVYADCLEWIENNDIHKLFKKDSIDLHVIIDSILGHEIMFKSKNQEGLTKDTYKKLQGYILQTTGRYISYNNISMDLKLIEQSLLNHLMYALNYEIGKAAKSNGVFNKELERTLKELSPKKYFKLFGRESMDIYKLCQYYLKASSQYLYDVIIPELRKYEDVIVPILEREKGRKKYDMINLVMCNTDVIEEDIHIVGFNIAETLSSHYQKQETSYVNNLLEQYSIIDRFTNGKYRYWQADFKKTKKQAFVKLRWFLNENVKNPIRKKIEEKNLLLYEGYENYYFCDTNSMCCYCMPKDKRVIMRYDKSHKNLCYKVA